MRPRKTPIEKATRPRRVLEDPTAPATPASLAEIRIFLLFAFAPAASQRRSVPFLVGWRRSGAERETHAALMVRCETSDLGGGLEKGARLLLLPSQRSTMGSWIRHRRPILLVLLSLSTCVSSQAFGGEQYHGDESPLPALPFSPDTRPEGAERESHQEGGASPVLEAPQNASLSPLEGGSASRQRLRRAADETSPGSRSSPDTPIRNQDDGVSREELGARRDSPLLAQTQQQAVKPHAFQGEEISYLHVGSSKAAPTEEEEDEEEDGGASGAGGNPRQAPSAPGSEAFNELNTPRSPPPTTENDQPTPQAKHERDSKNANSGDRPQPAPQNTQEPATADCESIRDPTVCMETKPCFHDFIYGVCFFDCTHVQTPEECNKHKFCRFEEIIPHHACVNEGYQSTDVIAQSFKGIIRGCEHFSRKETCDWMEERAKEQREEEKKRGESTQQRVTPPDVVGATANLGPSPFSCRWLASDEGTASSGSSGGGSVCTNLRDAPTAERLLWGTVVAERERKLEELKNSHEGLSPVETVCARPRDRLAILHPENVFYAVGSIVKYACLPGAVFLGVSEEVECKPSGHFEPASICVEESDLSEAQLRFLRKKEKLLSSAATFLASDHQLGASNAALLAALGLFFSFY